jgi:eukaryotic-like serine/threonine-protein kinase
MEGDSPADQSSPTKVGKYELRRVVGRGSIGIVYEGWDEVLRRIVAVKILRLIELDTPIGQEKYQRFQREAQAAARLYHPNIAMTFDYGETSSLAYIVMEFLEGPSLRERIERGGVDIDQIKRIMQGVLAGLQHSHEQGVVHRDIKPANILFSRGSHVKITDFGIARLDDSDLTQLGSQVGTPAYMSPEQVLGDTADARSDIYSAGVVLYEMLTGQRPFVGSTNSVMHKFVHSPAPRVSESIAEFSPAVDAVVAKALAKEQKDRYQTANEFWDALNTSLLSAPVSDVTPIAHEPSLESTIVQRSRLAATPVPEPAPAIMPARRARTGALASAVAAACLALVAVVWWLVHKPAEGPAAGSSSVNRADQAAPATHQQVAATNTAPAPPAAVAPAAPNHPAVPAPDVSATRPLAEPRSTATNVAPQRSALLAGLGGVAAQVPCSFVTARIGDGNAVILSGVTALGEASELEIRGMVRQSVAQLAPAAPVTWNVRRVEGPFCPIFDLIHPLAATTDQGLVINVADSSAGQSTDNTAAGQIRAVIPGFPSMLIVDAYSADGLVHHLYPGSAAAQKLPAGTKVSVSLPAVPGMASKNAGDQRPSLLVGIASSAALLDSSRPANEPMAGYLKALNDALARGQASGASVLADAIGLGSDSSK